MFRCYMLLQISVKHIQDESHLAKGKLWVEPALKWAMHFILYGIIRQYASILVTSKNSGSHAVTTWAMFKIQKKYFWLMIMWAYTLQYMRIITVSYGKS